MANHSSYPFVYFTLFTHTADNAMDMTFTGIHWNSLEFTIRLPLFTFSI
jgi:hypothetical protein